MSTEEGTKGLGWADYAVIGVMLSISTSIGIYYRFTGGRQKTTEEYFRANRSMRVVPVALALMVSFLSAVTLLGGSAETFYFGTQFTLTYLGSILGAPIAMHFYLPVFFKLQKTSTYEYLQIRFGTVARLTTSIAISMQLLLLTGVVLYAPSLALEATTGLSVDFSVALIAVICIFYSTVGGIKAVLITDVFQGSLMFVAILMVIISAIINVDGGISGIWQIALDGDRIEFDNFSIDPTMRHTWWSLVIGTMCTYLTRNAVNQVQVQRLLTVKTIDNAKLALWLELPIRTILGVATCFSGIAMYAYFSNCDPLAAQKISSRNMLMPYFVKQTMGHIPGLVGLFVAGIFSASLSTVSAMLNSLSAIALEDYIKPAYGKLGYKFPEKRGALIGKILVVIVGILCIQVSFIAKNSNSILQVATSIHGAIGGPLLGIFTLGMFFESAEEKGAVFGTLVSLAFMCWTAFGQPRPSTVALSTTTSGCNATVTDVTLSHARQTPLGDSSYLYLYRISYMWYSFLGLLICVFVGLIASNLIHLVTKEAPRESDPDLFTPFVARRIRRRQLNVSTAPQHQLQTSDEHNASDSKKVASVVAIS